MKHIKSINEHYINEDVENLKEIPQDISKLLNGLDITPQNIFLFKIEKAAPYKKLKIGVTQFELARHGVETLLKNKKFEGMELEKNSNGVIFHFLEKL